MFNHNYSLAEICFKTNNNSNHGFAHRFNQSSICTIASSARRYIKSYNTTAPVFSKKHGKCELDSHADSIVCGSNCVVLNYTGKECDVSPYREVYDAIRNVPIVTAATAWQSPITGQGYILIFNEAIWMGDHMDHTLLNPNQLRHYGVRVQDDPTSPYPLSIVTEKNEFGMELSMDGTIVYVETHAPSERDLKEFPHIELTSPHSWDPLQVKFPKSKYTLGDMLGDHSFPMSALKQRDAQIISDDLDSIFSLDSIQRKISSLFYNKPAIVDDEPVVNSLRRDSSIDPGTSDAPVLHTFQSSERHTDVTPQQLSERWGISLSAASKTLQKTTQKFQRSAILPLSRRYRADRVFSRKTLSGEWSTDTMDGRCKSLDGN